MEKQFKEQIAAKFVDLYTSNNPMAAAKYLMDVGIDADNAKEIAPEVKDEFERRGYTV